MHVHAKDITVEHADAERGKVTGTPVGCACGDGVIDWQRVIAILRGAGFSGVLSVECGTPSRPAAACIISKGCSPEPGRRHMRKKSRVPVVGGGRLCAGGAGARTDIQRAEQPRLAHYHAIS